MTVDQIPIRMKFHTHSGKISVSGAPIGCFKCNGRGHTKAACPYSKCPNCKRFNLTERGFCVTCDAKERRRNELLEPTPHQGEPTVQ